MNVSFTRENKYLYIMYTKNNLVAQIKIFMIHKWIFYTLKISLNTYNII